MDHFEFDEEESRGLCLRLTLAEMTVLASESVSCPASASDVKNRVPQTFGFTERTHLAVFREFEKQARKSIGSKLAYECNSAFLSSVR